MWNCGSFNTTTLYQNGQQKYSPGKRLRPTNVGDFVRVSYLRRPFRREYYEHWSRELFVVNGWFMKENVPLYQLKGYSGEVVSGTFHQNQLMKAYEQTDKGKRERKNI